MDAAVPVDAQTAPTATWKTAQIAVSHSAHTPRCLVLKTDDKRGKNERPNVNPASHTKFRTLPEARKSGYRDA